MIMLDATATYVRVRDAAFSTEYRYLRERNVATAYAIPAGATCAALVQYAGVDSSNTAILKIFWRYSCGGYVLERARPPTYLNLNIRPVAQTLVAPVVVGSSNMVDG